MNILWLRPTKPENISVGRERISEQLERRGHNVHIQDSSGLDAFHAIKEAMTSDYDVTIGTVRMGLYVGFLSSKILNRPFIADVTDPIEQIDDLPKPLYDLLYEYEYFVLTCADEKLYVYQSSYEEAKQRGINGKKVKNGVQFDRFNSPDPGVVESARSELEAAGVDLDTPIAMYIGGLTPAYHIREILDAAVMVDDVEFVFVGSGELRDPVTNAASENQNIHFLGSYEYELIPGFLACADIGLCLVDAEQPLKILEYGAAELPVLACYGELQQRFTNDEVIFVDPDELQSAILSILEDPEVYQSYAHQLADRAENADWKQIATEYEQALKRAIE